MKKNYTWIVFCVDKSGSMNSIKKDMIGGFNAFIKNQRNVNLGDCKVSFYQFSTTYDVIFEDVDLQNIKDLTENSYIPAGGTALYPSLGKTIENVGKRLSLTDEKDRPSKVLIVTITDGEHNSNLEGNAYQFNASQIKQMIEHQTQVYNWDFIYLGANQDSWAVGQNMGNVKGTTLNYVASAAGTKTMFENLTKSTTKYRASVDKERFAFGPDTTST